MRSEVPGRVVAEFQSRTVASARSGYAFWKAATVSESRLVIAFWTIACARTSSPPRTGEGDHTTFRREFELGSVLSTQQPLPYTIDNSRAENTKVKALVENILWREQKGRNLP